MQNISVLDPSVAKLVQRSNLSQQSPVEEDQSRKMKVKIYYWDYDQVHYCHKAWSLVSKYDKDKIL